MKILMFFLLALGVNAASLDDLTWTTTNEEVTITDCKTNASGELVIPATIEGNPVTSIGGAAFERCTSLTSITIPDGVTSIGVAAFRGCTSLTSITIPDSVTSLGEWAFGFCTNLTSITIPDGVTSIGESAFYQCTSLTTIEVGAGNLNYTGINGVLFNKEKTVLLTYPAGKTGDNYTIPNSVTSIGVGAFGFCTNLTSITIPDGVTSIGLGAFYECTSLTSITFLGTAPTVGSNAFLGVAGGAIALVTIEALNSFGESNEKWNGLIINDKEEECDNEELTNTITTLVALLAQKDAQIAEKNAQIAELEKRPSLEEIQEARAGSVVLTPTENGTVIFRMIIEESSDLSVWENNGQSVEVELPLAEGKKFLRFALE